MAVANDEWNGELTQFLDRLPARPCLVPPAPSFCSVCGSINASVARPCRFYALRHERERGQTFIELEPRRRADTFEIEVDFDEEEEELPGAQMFEFSRPPAAATIKGRVRPVATQKIERPVELEVYEAEVVEVLEEPPAAPAAKAPPAEDVEALARAEAEARKLESEMLENQARVERERELAEQADLERRVREVREREIAETAELERKARDEARAQETANAAPPVKVPDNQVLSKDEEERLEREIEEELAKAGMEREGKVPVAASPGKAQAPAVQSDKVIAPIYSQPIIKIIPSEREAPKSPPPPPPPPPLPQAPAPAPPENEPSETTPTSEPTGEGPEPAKPATAEEKPAPKPPAPALKEPAPVPGQRRTGGLYGIFRKAPKEQPKPDQDKNGVDDELAKRLKKDGK